MAKYAEIQVSVWWKLKAKHFNISDQYLPGGEHEIKKEDISSFTGSQVTL